MKGKTREKLKNNIHIQIKKYKGRTEYHDPYLYKDRQGKNKGTLHVITQGKTREELKNITHFHIGKDKGRTKKQKPY